MSKVGLVPIRNNCKVCTHPRQSEVLQAVYEERMTNPQAAETLGVTGVTWSRHLRNCVRSELDSAMAPHVDKITKTIIDKVEELVGQVDRVKGNLQRVCNVQEQEDDKIDLKTMQSYIMLEKQLSTTIELFAKITGDLTNSAIVNVTNNKIEFNDFRQQVLGTVCDQCRSKLISELENAGAS